MKKDIVLNKKLPVTIDYRMTEKCNMQCPFCFGTKCSNNINIDYILRFLGYARLYGCQNIVISGGEPTLHSDFIPIVRDIKNMGYRLFLSTNGTFWFDNELRNFILSNFETISLPLESHIREIHNELRIGISDHYQMMINILREYKKYENEFPCLKIGTVVSKLNIDTLTCFLNNIPIRPDIWKLYQLSKCLSNEDFYNNYRVSDNEFSELVNKIKVNNPYNDVCVTGSFEKDREGSYFFIEPNGDIVTIKDREEYILGNVDSMVSSTFDAVRIIIDYEKLEKNFSESFGARGK